MSITRRELLGSAGPWGAGILLAGAAASCGQEKPKPEEEIEVTPNEDLMREHGVLRRIVIFYDEAATRLEAPKDVPLAAVAQAAGIVRKFVEDYHEKLEEDRLFPRFEKAGILADLTKVLRDQHKAGRRLTDEALAILKADGKTDVARLAKGLRQFNASLGMTA